MAAYRSLIVNVVSRPNRISEIVFLRENHERIGDRSATGRWNSDTWSSTEASTKFGVGCIQQQRQQSGLSSQIDHTLRLGGLSREECWTVA